MKFDYFKCSQIDDLASKCVKALKKEEISVILFPPRISRVRFAEYVIQEYGIKDNIKQITFSPDESDNFEDINFIINNKVGKTKQDTLIFVTNADYPVRLNNFQVIDSFVKVQEEKPNYHFMLLFDMDITHPNIAKHFNRSSIFANVDYFPIYSNEDTFNFINYLENKWEYNIQNNLKEKIIYKCGGHFWLIKLVIRSFVDNPKIDLINIFQSDQIQFRLEHIYNSLLDTEKSVLRKIVKKEIIDNLYEKHSCQYLHKMNLIKNNEITISLLEDFIRNSMPKVNIELTEQHILLNNIRVDSHFSRQEKRALKVLIDMKNQIVTREQVAKGIWPINTEEKYTDWAIDRLIARLREKIISLGMSRDMIKTFRNKGYMLIN